MLLPASDHYAFLEVLHRPSLSSLARRSIAKKINDKCKKVAVCPHCGATNGMRELRDHTYHAECKYRHKLFVVSKLKPLHSLSSPLLPSSSPPPLLHPSSALLIGTVKKCGLLKIVHEKFRFAPSKQRVSQELQEFRQTLQEFAEDNRDLQPHITKAQVLKLLGETSARLYRESS